MKRKRKRTKKARAQNYYPYGFDYGGYGDGFLQQPAEWNAAPFYPNGLNGFPYQNGMVGNAVNANPLSALFNGTSTGAAANQNAVQQPSPNLWEHVGGFDGIITKMGKMHKIMQMAQQMGPFLKLFTKSADPDLVRHAVITASPAATKRPASRSVKSRTSQIHRQAARKTKKQRSP